MNRTLLIAAATALAAAGASGAKVAHSAAPRGHAAPAARDWSRVTAATPAGGFVMGNPNAKLKLVEYGSMTCPHCGAFDREGAQPLIDNYVKTGAVSWEFRNFIRDPFDLTAALVARCGGAANFFPLTRGFYATQKEWIGKLRAIPQSRLDALSKLPPQQQFPIVAKLAGLQQFAAARGVPLARTNSCLANQGEVTRLMQITNTAVSQYNVPGTPGFVLNGKLLEQTAAWDTLEPQLKTALKG